MTTEETKIVAYKGFDKDWSCRGHKFEFGKIYKVTGDIIACKNGFHACENPLDVFGYYPPGTSRYATVTQSGAIARQSNDTKIASARITVDAEIHLPDFIAKAVQWVIEHTAPANTKHAEGYRSAASSTGDQSAASSTGDQSAASSTGYQSAASSTGDQSAAMSSGYQGRVMGAKEGTALFLVYRDDNYDIKHAWAGIVGRKGIKPGVWYTLNANGKPVEV